MPCRTHPRLQLIYYHLSFHHLCPSALRTSTHNPWSFVFLCPPSCHARPPSIPLFRRLLLVSAAAGASIGSLAAPETTEIDVDAVAAAESDETSMAAAYRDVDGLLARLRPVLEAAVARVRSVAKARA